jgi:hypothetical protein
VYSQILWPRCGYVVAHHPVGKQRVVSLLTTGISTESPTCHDRQFHWWFSLQWRKVLTLWWRLQHKTHELHAVPYVLNHAVRIFISSYMNVMPVHLLTYIHLMASSMHWFCWTAHKLHPNMIKCFCTDIWPAWTFHSYTILKSNLKLEDFFLVFPLKLPLNGVTDLMKWNDANIQNAFLGLRYHFIVAVP